MNGDNTITELRTLMREGKIEPKEALLILFGSHADLLENQHSLGELVERIEKDLQIREQENKEVAKASEERIISTIIEVEKSILNSRKNDLELVEKKIGDINNIIATNPMVRVGKFVKAKPKQAISIGFGIMALSNIWFVDSFRRTALLLLVPLGFPKEWVDLLTAG